MYDNEPFDDYIRSILGYPNTNNMYMPENNNNNYNGYNSYSNYSANNMSGNQDLEQYYPEIYKIIYPMIQKRCSIVTGNITVELIEEMTNEIYSSVEVTNEINVNINVQNDASNNRIERAKTILRNIYNILGKRENIGNMKNHHI